MSSDPAGRGLADRFSRLKALQPRANASGANRLREPAFEKVLGLIAGSEKLTQLLEAKISSNRHGEYLTLESRHSGKHGTGSRAAPAGEANPSQLANEIVRVITFVGTERDGVETGNLFGHQQGGIAFGTVVGLAS
jgi:hypothetical protein